MKRVDLEEPSVEDDAYEAYGVEEVFDEVPDDEEVEQISSALDDLLVEESFVWKHGVLDSWHLVGKKVPIVEDAKGKGSSKKASSGDERVEFIGSFEGGYRRNVKMKPPKFRGEIRRGKTLFDWEAFGLEMLGRRKVVYPP